MRADAELETMAEQMANLANDLYAVDANSRLAAERRLLEIYRDLTGGELSRLLKVFERLADYHLKRAEEAKKLLDRQKTGKGSRERPS
jgi:hypothetical protein